MKISIVVPIYKGVKKLSKFLEQLSVQSSSDFELILVVDTFTENNLSEIDSHLKSYPSIKENFKLVFNSKRVGRTAALNAGIEIATGDYTILMSNTDKFEKTLVETIIQLVSKHKSDVIEFKASIKAPIKFDGNIRKTYKPNTEINLNQDIFAYTYAFDFNKIYKTDVLKKATQFLFTSSLNSRFTIELVFKTLLVAQTYSTIDKELITFKSEISENYNPLKQIRQWKSFQTFVTKNLEGKYASEYIYNFLFTQTLFTSKIVDKAKSKVLSSKYKADMISELHNLNLSANPYLLQKSPESILIEKEINDEY